MIGRSIPLLPVLRQYNPEKAQRDFIAGLTVALFALPQSMAFALIAGLPPSMGIVTAIVAPIFGAIVGSSEFLIDGPTNAVSAMIAANGALLASHGDLKVMVATLALVIGFGQCVLAAVRAGTLARFVSEPVLTGFTAGAGLYIAVNQLPSALGVDKKHLVKTLGDWKPPGDPLFDFFRTLASVSQANAGAIALAVASILVVRGLLQLENKLGRRIPSPFVTVMVVSVGAWLFGLDGAGPHKVKLVQDIEPITRALPRFALPPLTWSHLQSLAGPAFAIGFLGSVEAIAISKALAAKVGHRFEANRQLLSEGVCNIGVAFAGGFPASGSFTRSAVNYDAGATTRVSSIFSGVLVLVLVMLFAPLANFIPVAVLAGLLIHIGIRLINVEKMRQVSHSTRGDRWVMTATFAAVLLVPDLADALFLGVGLSILGAIRKAESFKLMLLREDGSGNLVEEPYVGQEVGSVMALDLQGELFFATAVELENQLKRIYGGQPKFIVLRIQQAYNMDHSCAEMLGNVSEYARSVGGRLIVSGIKPGMLATLDRAGVTKIIGSEAIFPHEPTLLGATQQAIRFARIESVRQSAPASFGQTQTA